MDHDECRQLIEHQIERWVRKRATEYLKPWEIVLRRWALGRPGETLRTFDLHTPLDDNVDPALGVEALIFGIVETVQRDANDRKAGMQFYTLRPVYDVYPELGPGRRKSFHAVPEEAEPEHAGEGTP